MGCKCIHQGWGTEKKRALLLDNQIKKVVDSRKVRHYKPVFSLNKNYWWRHCS